MNANISKLCFSLLSEAQQSALVSLFVLEQHRGKAAFVSDEGIGVWLSDLDFEEMCSFKNELGVYSIEKSVLTGLLEKGLLLMKPVEKNQVKMYQNVRHSYHLLPEIKRQICAWITMNEVKLPILVEFDY